MTGRSTPLRYYLYDEICLHNKRDDFWVVIHEHVLDLTMMLKDRFDSWNSNLEYLLAFGGKDLSHYFHFNHEPKTEISPITGKERVIFPPILEAAQCDLCKTCGKLWSQDPMYHIGRVTKRERNVRIINTFTGSTQFMKVCDEDTIYDIKRKYSKMYNSHAGSYLWRKFSYGGHGPGQLLMHETLDGNGLTDPCDNIRLPPPSLWLYYTDDFSIA